MAPKNKPQNYTVEMATTGPFSLKLFWGSGRDYHSEEFENPEPALECLYQLLELGYGISESDLERLYDFTFNFLDTPEPERERILDSFFNHRAYSASRHGAINCDFNHFTEYYSSDLRDSQLMRPSSLHNGSAKNLTYQQKLYLSS